MNQKVVCTIAVSWTVRICITVILLLYAHCKRPCGAYVVNKCMYKVRHRSDQPPLTHIIHTTRLKFFGHIARADPSMDLNRARWQSTRTADQAHRVTPALSTTWYGGRPRPRRHCVRWGPSSERGIAAPHFSDHFALARWPISATAELLFFICQNITRMWANAQRDGRPAKHRWRPLFNAAKFG